MSVEKRWDAIFGRRRKRETPRKTYPDLVSSTTKSTWSDRDANWGPQRWNDTSRENYLSLIFANKCLQPYPLKVLNSTKPKPKLSEAEHRINKTHRIKRELSLNNRLPTEPRHIITCIILGYVGQVAQAARRLAAGWMARVRSRVSEGVESFLHSFVSRLALGSTQPPIKWVPGNFPGGKGGRV